MIQNEYEILFIIKANLGDDKYTEIINKYKELVNKNEGEIISINPWGLRELPLTFEKARQGYFVESQFKATPKTLQILRNYFKVTEDIVRDLIVTADSVKKVAPTKKNKKEKKQHSTAPVKEVAPVKE